MLESNRWRQYIAPLDPIPSGYAQRGKPESEVRCLVFDIYGTLFISGSGDIGTAKGASVDWIVLENMLQRHRIGHSARELLDSFYRTIEAEHVNLKRKGIDYPEVDVIHIWQKVLGSWQPENLHHFALEFELIVNPVFPMPHLAELLAACRHANIKMGLISNAQFYTPILFDIFFDLNVVDLGFDPELTLFSYQIGRAKPSVMLYDLMGERLALKGIPRSSTLYVGNDMLNDIRPAKQAGYQTALFAGDARSLRMRENDASCRDLASDMVVVDLLQLVDFLDQQVNFT